MIAAIRLLIIFAALAGACLAESYKLDTVAFPDDLPPEIGDLAFDANGTLYAALRRGDVVTAIPTADPAAFQWRLFASGLHNPLGMEVVAPGHVVVSQMAELTEIIDRDGDGRADRYNNLSAGWGVSGNYHETNALCPDGAGGYYIAVGTASHNGPTFAHLRGPYSPEGRRGRNFSAVAYKGWVLHYAKDGTLTPHCSGFRMHNGIARSPDGAVWAGDNQGDWRGASPLYHCRKDAFSGHPASLVWDPRFNAFPSPLFWPRHLLDALHNPPALMLNYNQMRSCGEPLFITTDAFGPFAGQMLIPDENGPQIMRCMLEQVDGGWQGAATLFYKDKRLRPANNRLALSPDGGTLYVGQTARGWQRPNEGIQRLHFTGQAPFAVRQCNLETDGFQLRFTAPLSAPADLRNVTVTSFRYEYGYHYGSPQKDKRNHAVTSVSADNDGYRLGLSDLQPGRIYAFDLSNLRATDGRTIDHPTLEYTLNRLKRPDTSHRATISQADHALDVAIDGQLFARYNLDEFAAPIIWPINGPGQTRMVRNWPIIPNAPGEQRDHPHHKGIFIGHQSVNGTDFWHQGGDDSGSIEHVRLIETRSGEDRALIKTLNLWRDAAGAPVAADTRTLSFWGDDHARFIDLELHLHATHQDLRLAAMKDGLIGIRTHPHLRLNTGRGVPKVFGRAVNSEGVAGSAVWGKRADWVHYSGAVEGNPAGILFMSHPDNPVDTGKKAWWHARDYGLIAANPFAPAKIGGDGDTVIPKGQSLLLRYRFVFHDQSADSANAPARFADFANTPASTVSIMPNHPGYPE